MKIPELFTGLTKISSKMSWLMPNGGTILIVLLLIATQSIWAKEANTNQAAMASTNTISYQGQLTNSAGNPLNGTYNMVFKLYTASSGGTALWTESWTGGNAVDVTDGLFHVLLGSLNNTLSTVVASNNQLYLGFTVGTDSEMQPRVQLGSTPYSMQALTVADNSITTTNIVDSAITSAKMDVVEESSIVEIQENTTSTSWTPLTTPDIVNFTLQKSQWVDIFYGATAINTTVGSPAVLTLSVDGNILQVEALIETWSNSSQTMSSVHRVFLSAGSHSISLVYRTEPGGNAYFWRRKLLVFAISQ